MPKGTALYKRFQTAPDESVKRKLFDQKMDAHEPLKTVNQHIEDVSTTDNLALIWFAESIDYHLKKQNDCKV